MARYYDNSDQSQRFQPGTTVRSDEVDGKFDSVASGFSDVETDIDRSLKLVADGSNHEVSATASQRRNRVVGFDTNGDLALLRGFSWRGDYASGTEYFVNDVFRDPATKNLYVVEVSHTAGSSIDANKTDLAINVADVEAAKNAAKASEDEAEDWANKTSGLIDSSDYSAKAYAVGGSGVDGVIGSAKDWAIKTDDTVDGTNYSAKYWATDTNITTVASNIGDITTVATGISDVTTVSAEIGQGKDVTVVAGDLTGTDTIGTVAGSIANVNTTASSIASVNAVAGELGIGQDVTVVAADLSGADTIGTVAGSIANVNTVATDIADVSTVAGELGVGQDVTIVAANIADVGTVATNIASVNTTASISANVTSVAGISADVTAVAGDATDIGLVAANIADVSSVAGIEKEVDFLANDITGGTFGSGIMYDLGSITEAAEGIPGVPNGYVVTVYNNLGDIIAVSDAVGSVNTVAGISSDVQTVAGISANVTTVAGVASNVTTVAGIAPNVTTVSGIDSDVTAVAGIAADVTTAADNIVAIQNAPQAASDAADARDKAEQWANEAEDVEVEPGEYSAFHWAQKAQGFAQGDAVNISYDGTASGLSATNVQDAIDEVVAETAALDGGNTFTGNQTVTGDVTITGTFDCGSIA